MSWKPVSKSMTFATAPARRLVVLGAGLAVAAAVLGAPPAAAAAPPEGAYWHTRAVMTRLHPWQFGSKQDPYSLVERQVSERWTTPDGRSWYGYRDLGTLPATEKDKKAWQRDGSPAKWGKSIDGKVVKLSTEPAKGHVAPMRGERRQFHLAGQWLTYDEVQRLPADPNKLKDWLSRAGQVGEIPAARLGDWVTSTLPQLLYDLPAPKEVRAAAYQALLTSPKVRQAGAAKDTLGRPGTAVVIDESNGEGKKRTDVTMTLIIDTGRMVLLSRDQLVEIQDKAFPGKSYSETLTDVGWTDAQPAVPALP
ncbi:hypothetical protein [[Actinomadura] parvosata]|uniref:hypothetical protein n=2 Tax=[Actinomadura] parvosata TaxID=1955412 RepID=UPI001647AE8A